MVASSVACHLIFRRGKRRIGGGGVPSLGRQARNFLAFSA